MSETCGKNCACAAAASSEVKTSTEAKTSEPKKADAPKARTFRNGKGSAPRNISTKFRSNYDQIKWA